MKKRRRKREPQNIYEWLNSMPIEHAAVIYRDFIKPLEEKIEQELQRALADDDWPKLDETLGLTKSKPRI
jgi:hypothetical protein